MTLYNADEITGVMQLKVKIKTRERAIWKVRNAECDYIF